MLGLDVVEDYCIVYYFICFFENKKLFIYIEKDM